MEKVAMKRLRELAEAFNDIANESLMLETCGNTDGWEIESIIRELIKFREEKPKKGTST